MSMKDSSELPEVAAVLFHEIQRIYGLGSSQFRCWIIETFEKHGYHAVWSTDQLGSPLSHRSIIPLKEHPVQKRIYNAYKKGKPFIISEFSADQAASYTNYLSQFEGYKGDRELQEKIKILGGDVTKKVKNYPKSNGQLAARMHEAFYRHGRIGFLETDGFLDLDHTILMRFAKVFEQTYTRFLDLQKAEEHAWESKIEAALEKVRAAGMAMHHSDDLANAAAEVFKQVQLLGVPVLRSGFDIIDLADETLSSWISDLKGEAMKKGLHLPVKAHPLIGRVIQSWKEQEDYFEEKINRRTMSTMVKAIARHSSTLLVEYNRSDDNILKSVWMYEFWFLQGGLYISSLYQLSEHEKEICLRLAKVFEQTYTRFLDLQKAEAQARQAQIEAALERIRAASMAMHKSSELHKVIHVIFDEIKGLGFEADACGINIGLDLKKGFHAWMATESDDYPRQIHVPYLRNVVFDRLIKAQKENIEVFADEIKGRSLKSYVHHAFSHSESDLRRAPKNRRKLVAGTNVLHRSAAFVSNGYLILTNHDRGPYTEEQNDIIRRMALVFDQAYTRFRDLQKAEAQARKAQIEAALERVRSASMAMHHSSDLHKVSTEVLSQLSQLDITADVVNLLILDATDDWNMWTAARGGIYPEKLYVPYRDLQIMRDFNESKNSKRKVFAGSYSKRSKDAFFNHLNNSVSLPKKRFAQIIDARGLHCAWVVGIHSAIHVSEYKQGSFPDDQINVIARFNEVFEQAYTRFLDLQKAEAQAREAQIEAALERVRAASMAMHESQDITQVTQVIFDESQTLGIEASRCTIAVADRESKIIRGWSTTEGENTGETIAPLEPLLKIPVLSKIYTRWINYGKNVSWSLILEGKDLKNYLEFARTNMRGGLHKEYEHVSPDQTLYFSAAYYKYGWFVIRSENEQTHEQQDILLRFSQVFEQSYTRFLDLQRAEAQTREAEIEAGLERVRAASMAMHETSQLRNVLQVLFGELNKLEVEAIVAWMALYKKDKQAWELRVIGFDHELPEDVQYEFAVNASLQTGENTRAWESGEEFIIRDFVEDEVIEWSNSLIETTGVQRFEVFKELDFIQNIDANNKYGTLGMASSKPYSPEQKNILRRFSKVFEQAYTRFLDLQKAEERTREAEIEASMERVRSRAMAMHRTDELNEVVGVIFDELKNLGFDAHLCSIGIYDGETKGANWWSYIEGHDVPGAYHYPYLDGRWFKEIYEAWIAQKPYHYIEMFGKEKDRHTKLSFEQTDWKNLPDLIKSTLIKTSEDGIKASYVSMKKGMLEIVTFEPLTQEQIVLLQRFTKVIDLTYTRVDDLEQSEARETEAQRQASLDRIRAEISSMQHVDDLLRITPLFWKELTALNIPFFRCGIFIMDEVKEEVEVFLSNPEGEALTTLRLPFDSADNISNLVAHWKKKELFQDEWDQEQFVRFFQSMMSQGHMTQEDTVIDPPERLFLKFFPFHQGMLYVGSEVALNEDEMEMVKRMAQTFQEAYVRYEDYVELEAAKGEAEAALGELKEAQTQLIHSEKMASLGELTAGIAHEIQNPLNFVNNFSDVSGELIDEISEEFISTPLNELTQEHVEEVKDILEDLKTNLEKIHHHGERASSIVKGMLSHSRASTTQKELTDINNLCDEYIRLSYHGLRAKDRSFNSGFETHLEESIPQVKIVPQEIGRVILNILNNAFYAVDQRRRREEGHKPMVSISAKVLPQSPIRQAHDGASKGGQGPVSGNCVEIRIKDNGSGIPRDIQDKIFQPFFTTKPTGSGTGLGLSLSYDIVTKGHGGDLRMMTKEGEGTEFVIELPVYRPPRG